MVGPLKFMKVAPDHYLVGYECYFYLGFITLVLLNASAPAPVTPLETGASMMLNLADFAKKYVICSFRH